MTFKQSLATTLVLVATSVGSIWGYAQFQKNEQQVLKGPGDSSILKEASYTEPMVNGPIVDFEKAANKAVPAVVHVTTVSKAKQVSGRTDMPLDLFEEFFGEGFGGRGGQFQAPERKGSGSGVIVTADGYIVTNNHVIDGADEVSVTLNNKKTYKGKVIGKDPSTDLAVIKIDAKDLPTLAFANSDQTRLGQWVLAIGYPLNLEATVTSGIVSAKSRSIGINSRQSKTPVEAFIQTDAAINPGNSGGALVNTEGDVIGINSAIASPTGSYAGYGYAIPSNLVKKVAGDIIKYGSTKRAYLGVMFGSDQMSEEDRKKNNVKDGDGVFVMDVAQNSAAQAAGIQKGDFITRINGAVVNSGTQLMEKIATQRPGDKVELTYQRNGTERTTTATLKGDAGSYASMKAQIVDQLGASFESLDKSKAAGLGISSGVVVTELGNGILAEQTRIKEGFIITKVNNKRVGSVEELKQVLSSAGSSAIISGIYPNQPGREYQYALNDLP